MAMNSNNTPETSEQDKKKNHGNLKQEFLKDLIDENRNSASGKLENSFIKDVMKKDPFPESILIKMRSLKAGKDKYKNDLNIESIDVFDLRRLVSNDYLRLESARNLFIARIRKDYSIDNEKQILDLIKDESADGIHSYINNPNDLEKLLSNEKENNNIRRKDTENLFSGLKGLDDTGLEERFDEELTEDQKKDIKGILFNIKHNDIRNIDIIGLFEYDFLEDEEKKSIMEVYIPVISLGRALDIGLINKIEAEKKKEVILKEFIGDSITDKDILKELYNRASFDDILLESKDLYRNDNLKINLLAKNEGFKNLEQDFLSLKETVQDDIKENGPQGFDDLVAGLDEINENNRFKNLEKFKKGNIVKYITRDNEGKPKIDYFLISSVDEENNKFFVKNIGQGDSITLETTDLSKNEMTYSLFLGGLQNDTEIRFECFDHKEIKEKINSGELEREDFEKVDITSLDTDKIEKYRNDLNNEIIGLQDEINDETDDIIKKQKEKLIEQKLNLFNNLENDIKEKNSLSLNKINFIKKLDQINPHGKNVGFDEGIYIGVGIHIYEVLAFNDSGIILENTVTGEKTDPFSFNEFLGAFKTNEAKRLLKIETFDEIISKNLSDSEHKSNKKWDKHKIIDGKLVAEGIDYLGKRENQKVDFLVGDKTNEVIKINSINGNYVKVQFGDRKDYEDMDKDTKKKLKIGDKDNGERIRLEALEYNITLDALNALIKEGDLYPNWKTGKNIEPEEIEDLQNKFHGSFISRFFKRKSINELLAGGKMLVDGIEEVFKKGNELHAAEFALALGKFIPGDLSEDMQVHVERAQQEQQDKEIESLGKVDSPIATKRIKKWLQNKDTPEYKKEAAVLFMLENYGHLSAKGALYEFRGKWMWYEALGGRVNDKLFQEIKDDAEKIDKVFSEEYLVHILLKQQCSRRRKPFRRSRFHKEYEYKWKTGIKEEYEKGHADAEKKRSIKDIIKGGHDEAKTGTTSNAIGWFKKAVERGGSLEDMSEGFFCLFMSGSLFNIDQATYLKLKEMFEQDGSPMIMLRFSTQLSDMKLFNDTIVEISKIIEKKYPDYIGIAKEAEDIRNDSLNNVGKESDRYNRSIEFWKKYGTPVSRALNMVNKTDSDYSKTDKVVYLDKEKNDTLKKYYDNVRGYTNDIKGAFGQGFMEEDCGSVGITGLNVYRIAKKFLYIDNTRRFREEAAESLWREIAGDINNINNKEFSDDKDISDEEKRKYLLHVLKDLTAGIISNVGKGLLEPYNDSTKEIGRFFNNCKLHLKTDLGGFTPDSILNGEADNVLKKAVERILEGKADGGGYYNPLDELTSSTKKATDNIAQNNPFS